MPNNKIYRITIIIAIAFYFTNCIAQNKYNRLMTYDIKGISINNKLICPLNGFNYGTVDYGIYKQRGFYFAINNDNAALGEGITILETLNFTNFNDYAKKGMKCTLKELGDSSGKTFQGSFMEMIKDEIIYLTITDKVNGKDVIMMYIMTSQASQ